MARIINWLIGLNLLFLAFAISAKFLTGHFEVGFITWSGLIISLLFGIALFLKKNKPKGRVAFYVFTALFFLSVFLVGIFNLDILAAFPILALGMLVSAIYGILSKQLYLNTLTVSLLGASGVLLLISIIFKLLHWQYAETIFLVAIIISGCSVIYHYFVQPPSI